MTPSTSFIMRLRDSLRPKKKLTRVECAAWTIIDEVSLKLSSRFSEKRLDAEIGKHLTGNAKVDGIVLLWRDKVLTFRMTRSHLTDLSPGR